MVTETTKNSTDMIKLLKKYGFTKDETAPIGVNRWTAKDDNGNTTLIVTLNAEGTEMLHGCFVFETPDQTHNLIVKRKVSGNVDKETMERLMDRNAPDSDFPDCVKIYPLNTEGRWNRLNR